MRFTRNSLRVAAAATLLAGVAAGCTNKASTTPQTSAPTSSTLFGDTVPPTETVEPDRGLCTLLSADELSIVLGKPVDDGEPDKVDGVPTCTWHATGAPVTTATSAPISVMVAVLPYTADDSDTLQELAGDTQHNTVLPDLGDFAIAQCAFSNTDGCPWQDKVFVVLGDRYLEVELSNFAMPEDYQKSQVLGIVTAIAQMALPRI